MNRTLRALVATAALALTATACNANSPHESSSTGFHRGGFASGKPRVLATLTWDSPASLKALSERNYTFVPQNGAALGEAQRYALT